MVKNSAKKEAANKKIVILGKEKTFLQKETHIGENFCHNLSLVVIYLYFLKNEYFLKDEYCSQKGNMMMAQ